MISTLEMAERLKSQPRPGKNLCEGSLSRVFRELHREGIDSVSLADGVWLRLTFERCQADWLEGCRFPGHEPEVRLDNIGMPVDETIERFLVERVGINTNSADWKLASKMVGKELEPELLRRAIELGYEEDSR